MKLLIATRNPHKVTEIRAILSSPTVDLVSLDQMPVLPEVDEDGDTFQANAEKKAKVLAEASGMWALADDSGLEVDALGGAPGVWSARYAGEPVSCEANNEKLLAELVGRVDRRARFRCVIALASPDGVCRTVDGACEGRIAEALSGEHGFGYDPLFVPEGYEVTFAEMGAGEKNKISHRGRALAAAAAAWAHLLAA